MDNELLRQKYRPEKVKVLLVGESPPKNGAFFYEGKNANITTFTKKAFESASGKVFQSNNDFFEYMKKEGYYLEDLSQKPVNMLEVTERQKTLAEESKKFGERVAKMKPDIVVIIMRGIERIVRLSLKEVKCEAVICAIPFPGNGHQNRYQEQLIPIIRHVMRIDNIINSKK